MNPTTPDTFKLRCMFCQAILPGSDENAERVSHGACKPLCKEAEAFGWKMPSEKPVSFFSPSQVGLDPMPCKEAA